MYEDMVHIVSPVGKDKAGRGNFAITSLLHPILFL
jgi:hypothetical protein